MTLADLGEPEPTPVWAENWEVMEFFMNLATQWNHGFNGPTGLNYAAIEPTMRLLGIEVENSRDFFLALRELERGALLQLSENQKRASKK